MHNSTNDIATLKGCFAVNSCLLSYSSTIIPTIHAIVRENRLNSYVIVYIDLDKSSQPYKVSVYCHMYLDTQYYVPTICTLFIVIRFPKMPY